ncbi:MAG: response regulator transcription factor [Actinomycetota bacterium]|nr:response regulator transcription factor [Actinomycetota bacterium]
MQPPRTDSPDATRPRLLVVEDDANLLRALRRGLELEGYAVDVAETGPAALAAATAAPYDAVVLDVMLPGIDGFEVCGTLRRRGRGMPVLMLTALTDVSDRIRGLDHGADDYLVKPFDFGELLARLRSLTRRGLAGGDRAPDLGDLRIDAAARVVTRGDRRIGLTERELAVLELLAGRAGRVVTRAELLDRIWGAEYDGSPNVVDVYVGYLRRKLERPGGPPLIRTVRGVGFMLEPV